MDTMRKTRLEPKRLRLVHSDKMSEAKMVLIEAVKDGRSGLKVERPLFMYKNTGEYSEEMLSIYGKE
jgi:tRNA1(Val) A37 N6-methylase TrmN6